MSTPADTSSPPRSSRLSKAVSYISKIITKNTGRRRHSHVEPQLPTTNPEVPQTLYLRVNRQFLLLLPDATEDQPNPQPLPPLPGTTGNLDVIIADLPDLHPFAGDTVDWLIKVARLIFQPLGTSFLYTFTTESVEWWLGREIQLPLWRVVMPGEQLRATIYEFRPNNDALIALTKRSLRDTRSVTTNTSVPRAAQLRTALLRRDQTCIITHETMERLLIASHLIPRRLGDLGVQSVMQRFTGPSTIVDRYDPAIGVSLLVSLCLLADGFELGFWNNGPDQYVVHSFIDSPRNIWGGTLFQNFQNDRALHGCQIALLTHDPLYALPPVGVFDWHYIQCVLKKFSTPAYQQTNNINYFSFPFRTRDEQEEDESDIDFDDPRNIANPPYPSYFWDLAELRAHQRLEAVERNRAIVTWSSGVSVS